jgi:glycosyltransferase involved in cell wall biosynthesis
MFVANLLACVKSEDDKILLKACLDSILPVVDRVILGWDHTNPFPLGFPEYKGKIQIVPIPQTTIDTEGFALARNTLLNEVEIGDYILWVDSDEVHFTEELKALRQNIIDPETYGIITTHFVHFCIHSNRYERYERRGNIFQKHPDTKWEGKVHEKLSSGLIPKPLFHSAYSYHHYGYVRPQEYVFSRWHQYAKLEGQENPYMAEEVDGKVVPYFREGRKGPEEILNDRLKTLIQYHGEYPDSMPREWIISKLAP